MPNFTLQYILHVTELLVDENLSSRDGAVQGLELGHISCRAGHNLPSVGIVDRLLSNKALET
jgi:hypothetical protein